MFGKPARNFAPRTIWTGDNLDILRGINSETVDLIYLDPPFNSNRTYSAPIGSKAAGAAFEDTWTLDKEDVAWMGLIADQHPAIHSVVTAAGDAHSTGMQSYLRMMAVRLLELRRVLAPTGSIYLHCDPTASHYLKLLMDSVFGTTAYRNDIVWVRDPPGKGAKRGSSQWPRNFDVLLFYAKTGEHYFAQQYVPLNESQRKNYRYEGKRGRYKAVQRGDYSDASWEKFRQQDKLHVSSTGKEYVKYYLADAKATIGGAWTDIYGFGTRTAAKERIGYPTQKPLALLNRIIEASSNPGDVVLDPFCGCATACVAADNLQREWVGIDISPMAVELVHMRLRDALGELYHAGMVTARTDIPRRTDIETPINYRQNRHVLFGEQEGKCNGCKMEFPFRNFTTDHIVPRSRGGTDHRSNLQLLCHFCNSTKGDRPMEYLMARLKELKMVS